MSNLFEQYQSHEISQTIENKLSEINNALDNVSYNESQINSLQAFQQLILTIKANLMSRNLPLVPQNILNQLNAAIKNLSLNLLPNIDASYTQYQALMDWFKRIPTIEKKSEVKESLNQIIENFKNKQNKISEEINSEIVNFKSLQEEELNSWNDEKKSMQSEIEQLKQDKIKLEENVTSLSQKLLNQENKMNELISAFKNDYETNKADFEERFTNKEKEYDTKIENLLNEQKNAAKVIITHLEQRQDEVEKLWGIIGKSGTVGNASSKASEHKKFADTMMWWTIVLMCIALIIIAIATWKLFSGKYTYMSFVWKVLTSAIILAPAFYCANISKRQRDREFQLRDFEIKTATLEPFMENMFLVNENANSETINKDKVKLELTKIFFDKQFSNTNSQNDCILLPKEIVKILNSFAKKCNFNINLGDKNE